MASSLNSLSLETEKKLAEIFAKTSLFEAEIEKTRYTLSKNPDFDPYSAFQSLDSLNLESLSSIEFQTFLSKNRIFCTNDEAYLLVRQYDSGLKGRLSFTEFLNLVLPSTSPGFGDLALSRQRRLTAEVEQVLLKLIKQEISYHRSLEELRREIVIQNDFNLLEAFRLIDANNESLIDRFSLLRFLQKYFKIFDHDIDAILRRLDNDGDGFLNYSEFVDSVMPSRKFKESPESQQTESKIRNSSPLRQPFRPLSPQKTRPLKMSSLKNTSAETSQKSVSFKEPVSSSSKHRNSEKGIHLKPSPLQSKTFAQSLPKISQEKDLQKIQASSRRSNFEVFQDIIPVLQDHIKLTRQLESVKNSLALRHDFNLEDVFKLFDQYDLKIVSSADVISALNSLSFQVQEDHLQLLIRSYSKIQDNRLRFTDFSDMLTPRSEEYSRILKSRASRGRVFSKETQSIFLNAFSLLIDLEVVSEKHRQGLAGKGLFKYFEVFSALDRDHNGYISLMDFSELFKELGVPFKLVDLQAVMQKFDKNNDGRISYNEFLEELTRKSNLDY